MYILAMNQLSTYTLSLNITIYSVRRESSYTKAEEKTYFIFLDVLMLAIQINER